MECGGSTPLWVVACLDAAQTLPRIQSGVEPPHSKKSAAGRSFRFGNNRAGFTGPVQVLVGVAQQGATSRGSAQGLFDTQLITVGVGDLALSAAGVGVSASEGTSANGITVATFTDQDPNAAASDFTASINWGDSHISAGTVTLGSGGMLTVTGTNTYKEAGTYPVLP